LIIRELVEGWLTGFETGAPGEAPETGRLMTASQNRVPVQTYVATRAKALRPRDCLGTDIRLEN
jgi:hypothetical protein